MEDCAKYRKSQRGGPVGAKQCTSSKVHVRYVVRYCMHSVPLFLDSPPGSLLLLLYLGRVVTRRAFKTKQQLATSDAERWKMARENIGWHEMPPRHAESTSYHKAQNASRKHGNPSAPGGVGRTTAEAGETLAAKRAVEEMGGQDNRPRKRAIVRKPKREKVYVFKYIHTNCLISKTPRIW